VTNKLPDKAEDFFKETAYFNFDAKTKMAAIAKQEHAWATINTRELSRAQFSLTCLGAR